MRGACRPEKGNWLEPVPKTLSCNRGQHASLFVACMLNLQWLLLTLLIPVFVEVMLQICDACRPLVQMVELRKCQWCLGLRYTTGECYCLGILEDRNSRFWEMEGNSDARGLIDGLHSDAGIEFAHFFGTTAKQIFNTLSHHTRDDSSADEVSSTKFAIQVNPS